MISERIEIWNTGDYRSEMSDGFRPVMDTYILEGKKNRPAVLVCPGGAYAFTSEREAEPIALQFNAAGFHAFVLYYSVAPRRHPQPLLDLSKAMCIIRDNAFDWKLDVDKIAVCGFSAGGHLTASLGVHWNKPWLEELLGEETGKNKPNAIILSYPVISSGEKAHRGSFNNLLGKDPSQELLEEMSLENQVAKGTTPPAFIWHTFADMTVPVENSLYFARAMRKNDIPFELHIFPDGPHGLSLANKETSHTPELNNAHVAKWVELCVEWLKEL